jgi:hypothetical protein
MKKMHYVILRDDDTNALTPAEYLERLYRPFLDRGFPVNLAVIPDVSTTIKLPGGATEEFLMGRTGFCPKTAPIRSNKSLVNYIKDNPGYRVVQHGCYHHYLEFECADRPEIRRRLQSGAKALQEAGFPPSKTFVAPYDRFSKQSLKEAAKMFPVISTGWYEWRRLPLAWRPRYLMKKMLFRQHWRAGGAALLTHPGCLLSCHRNYTTMLQSAKKHILRSHLSVLVTHWWEYFREQKPDEPFIQILHQVADFLDKTPEVTVVSFDAVAEGAVPVK